jgi:hypothetical protein
MEKPSQIFWVYRADLTGFVMEQGKTSQYNLVRISLANQPVKPVRSPY